MSYVIKTGVTTSTLSLALKEQDGSASDLSDSVSLTLRVWFENGTVDEFDLTVTGLPTAGTCERVWLAGETDIPGVHRAEVVSVDGSAGVTKWPSDGFFDLQFSLSTPAATSYDIAWAHVSAMDSSLSSTSAAAQDYILAHVNAALNADAFGGESSAKYRLARIYLAAHHGTMLLRSGAAGTVQAESEEGVSVTYAILTGTSAGDSLLDSTSWGQLYQELVRTSRGRLPFVI